MAATDHQKQLFNLIRGFATEKSQGERRVTGLKKRIQELQSEIDEANADLIDIKSTKESAEQELKGYEFELALNETTIQALEARICLTQDEISKIGSVLDAIKNEDAVSRDEFIAEMFEFNKKIRNLQETIAHTPRGQKTFEPSSDYVNKRPRLEIQHASKEIEEEVAQVISEIQKEEQEYQEEQNINNKLKDELVDLEKKVSIVESVVKEMKEYHELTKQITELETKLASLGEELQRMCECPSCHLDNSGALGEILQANQGAET